MNSPEQQRGLARELSDTPEEEWRMYVLACARKRLHGDLRKVIEENAERLGIQLNAAVSVDHRQTFYVSYSPGVAFAIDIKSLV